METFKVEAVVLKTDDFGGNVTLHSACAFGRYENF